MVLKKILVLHDFSEGSERALEQSIEISRGSAEPAEIIVLHVLAEIPLHGTFSSPIWSKKTGEWVTSTEQHLKEVYHSMKVDVTNQIRRQITKLDTDELPLRIEVTIGDPYDKAIEYIDSESIDVAIIASERFKGFAKIKALGDVGIRLANDAECPVMIIH